MAYTREQVQIGALHSLRECRALVRSLGPLAHLVERIHGMDEVTGSIPVGSTKRESLA